MKKLIKKVKFVFLVLKHDVLGNPLYYEFFSRNSTDMFEKKGVDLTFSYLGFLNKKKEYAIGYCYQISVNEFYERRGALC